MPLEPPQPEAYAAFTAPAIASIAAVVAGILLLHRRPLPGFLLGVAGLVVHGAFGGPSFGGFVPALVLSLGLLRARGLNRAAAWLPLLLVASSMAFALHRLRWRRRWHSVGSAGVLGALFTGMLFFERSPLGLILLASGALAGAICGWIYWRIAVRKDETAIEVA